MPHWQCLVCGFISASEEPPENCPLCAAPRSKFRQVEVPAVATTDREQLYLDWEDEIQSVGLLLAYGRQAEEDGYPEIAQALYQMAREEAWHAAQWAAITGLVDRTQDNLRRHLKREDRAMEIKRQLADHARQSGDQEAAAFFERAAADERRHRAVIASLLRRFFEG